MLLVTYGSFRKGGELSYYLDLLRDAGYSEDMELPGLKIFVMGQVPGAVITNNPDDVCVVEMIKADLDKESESAYLTVLDQVEGVLDIDQGLYKRDQIDTPKGKAIIYTICSAVDGCVEITDWNEWRKKSKAEMADAMDKAGDRAIIIPPTRTDIEYM